MMATPLWNQMKYHVGQRLFCVEVPCRPIRQSALSTCMPESYLRLAAVLKSFHVMDSQDEKLLYFITPPDVDLDIRMNKKVRRKKLNASVKPVRAVPTIPASKWTSTIES
jgi:hypothetical protein